MVARKRVFISFDVENDASALLKLVGQSAHSDSPIDYRFASSTEPWCNDRKEKFDQLLDQIDLVIVLCGARTGKSVNVNGELAVTRENGKPYILLAAHPERRCEPPASASPSDKLYVWTWETVKALACGVR